MRTWVIITCSLIDSPFPGRDYATRKMEYQMSIPKIIDSFKNCNIVIVENNSIIYSPNTLTHKTFLNSYGVPVIYTKTNKIVTRNYGKKELIDVHQCITKLNIPDDDFIVKITGRYLLDRNCPFVNEVNNLDKSQYDALIRYGCYEESPCFIKKASCITGLIGLRCKYVKEMNPPDEDIYVEETWARKIMSLDDSKVCILEILGIYIRPAIIKNYFLV